MMTGTLTTPSSARGSARMGLAKGHTGFSRREVLAVVGVLTGLALYLTSLLVILA